MGRVRRRRWSAFARELFEKSSLTIPQKLSRKNKSIAGKNSPILVWERTALFLRHSRKRRGPTPSALRRLFNRVAGGDGIRPYEITKNSCPICLPVDFQRQTQNLNF
jgi:hypothetical protein